MFRQTFRRTILATISILAAAAVVAGCTAAPHTPTEGLADGSGRDPAAATRTALWPHEQSDLAPDPAVVFGRLPNGFRYVLMENREPNDRVSMHLNVQAGSLHETEDQRGLAHYLEHMLFNGTEHFPPGELVKYFQRIGMQFGADANAHTGFSETVYDIRLPDGGSESIAEGLLVMQDYAAGALLPEDEVARERGIILAEKQTRDSVGYRTFVATLGFEMADTRLVRRLPIGTEKTIREADRARLKDYYDTWYRPEKMILVMVGDFDVDSAEEMIRQRFAEISARAAARPEPEIGTLNHQGLRTFYHPEEEAGNTTVSIETLSTVSPQNDTLSLQEEEILRRAGSQIVQNRLERRLRQPDAPFTTADVSTGRFLQQIAYSEISAEGPPEAWEASLTTLEQTLRQALAHGFTDAELDRVRKEMLAGLDTAVRKSATRDSQRLARNIIRHLNDNRVFQSPAQENARFEEHIAGMTRQEVHRAFRDAWAAGHRLVLITGNARIGSDTGTGKEIIRTAYLASRSQPVSPPADDAAVDFPFFPVPKAAGAVAAETKVKDLDILQVDFENGVRLNFKRTDFKADEVRMQLAFGYGRSSQPAAYPGLADVAEGVINESGMGPLTRDQLDRSLAGKNTVVDFAVAEDRFLFRVHTVPGELELAFQLLYGHLTRPALGEDALGLTVQRLKQQYGEMIRSIEGQMRIQGERFLAGGDTRFGLADPDALDRIRMGEVRDWILKEIERARPEISIVGDADPEAVAALAARYLGSLEPRTGTGRDRTDIPAFPAGERRTLSVGTDISKSMVVVAWPTDDFWDIQRTRRLSVLSQLFSERLRERIREKLGVAYSPYAYNRSSRAYQGYGRLLAVVPTDPEAALMVADEVQSIARELAADAADEGQFQRVLEPILTSLKDLRRKNGYWLESVLTGSARHPEQLDWARTIVEDYGGIEAADVHRLASKYLDERRSAVLVIVPEEKVD